MACLGALLLEHKLLRRLFISLTIFVGATNTPYAQTPDLRGPEMAAASNFGQAWYPEILRTAASIPVLNFRDEIYWERIEGPDGVFRFNQHMTLFPAMVGSTGATVL